MRRVIVTTGLLLCLGMPIRPGHASDVIIDTTGGDCSTIGTWSAATMTCTMTQDFTSVQFQDTAIEIQGDGVTLDCAGHSIDGTVSNKCIWSTTRYATGIVVRNCVFLSCHQGIRGYDGRSHLYEHNYFVGTGWGNGIVGYRIGSSTIRYNDVANSLSGISMEITQGGNFVYGNRVHGNNTGVRWDGSASDNSEFLFENLIDTNGVGVATVGAHIIIHHNDLIDNTEQALSSAAYSAVCGSETWDLLGAGNHWSDYAGTDGDDNGIGDTPYPVPCADGSNLTDDYPLMRPVVLIFADSFESGNDSAWSGSVP